MEPKQIDVLSDGMSKLLYQWKDSPNLQAFVRALLLQLKDVEVAYYQLLNERGIYVAVGAQLDLLGKLVGEARLGRSDTPYRQAILGRVALNQASGTIDDVKHTVKSITDSDFVALFEHYPLATYIYVPKYINRDGEKIIDRSHIAGARTRVLWTEEPENIIFSDIDQASYTELLHTGEGEQIIVNDNGTFELQVSFHSFIASESYFTSIVPGATSYEVVDEKGKMASLVPLQEVDVTTGYIIDQDGNYLIDNFGNYIRYVNFGSISEDDNGGEVDYTSNALWEVHDGAGGDTVYIYDEEDGVWNKSDFSDSTSSPAGLRVVGDWAVNFRPSIMRLTLNSADYHPESDGFLGGFGSQYIRVFDLGGNIIGQIANFSFEEYNQTKVFDVELDNWHVDDEIADIDHILINSQMRNNGPAIFEIDFIL